ncbi:thioredoxin domain-containing protein 9 like protein [Quercus suber]|uniref:Thioredoxin domain-containing protein 9 like protein n=1 Tax=Quercus suber TaxID=58331 RepID=A0AAW0LVI6_QUESU
MGYKCSEDKLDEEIAALDRLDLDNLEVLRERRLQQMKKMVEQWSCWISLGHGEYTKIFSKKDFFSTTRSKAR